MHLYLFSFFFLSSQGLDKMHHSTKKYLNLYDGLDALIILLLDH